MLTSEPEVGGIYLIHSRNLLIGAYAGNGRFIGIREKFGFLYLDSEWLGHTVRKAGKRLGTVPEGTALGEDNQENKALRAALEAAELEEFGSVRAGRTEDEE